MSQDQVLEKMQSKHVEAGKVGAVGGRLVMRVQYTLTDAPRY